MLGPLLAMPIMVSGGFFVNSDRMIWLVELVQWVSPIYYNFSALVDNEFGGEDEKRLIQFLALERSYEESIMIMLCLIVLFHIIAVTMLRVMIQRF